MAAPCGCGGSAVTVEGEDPICVDREGVRPVRFVVRLCQDLCTLLMDCLRGGRLGPGLTVDEGTGRLQVKLSDDAGNATRFGTDNGVFTPGGEPVPDVCGQTISDLPAEVVGAKSLAGLHHPYSSPFGVNYCLANHFDMIHFIVGTNADDVGTVSEFWTHQINSRRSSIYITQDIRQLNTSTIQSVLNYAGNKDNPREFQPADSEHNDASVFDAGGWWGWSAARYHQPLAEDFLRTIAAKSIALLACRPSPDSFITEATNLRGAMRAITQQCAQQWAMISVGEIANATTVMNAGMTPMLDAQGPVPLDTWGVTDLPYPVADVTAAGIEWMLLSDHFADSVFSAYRDAGVNVLMMGSSRQSQKQRVRDLNIRGALVLDPLYYRGTDDGFGYRSASDPWQHRRPSVGQLTYRTDQQDVRSTTGHVRGFVEAGAGNQGLTLPAGFGNGQSRPSVLVGWESPMINSDTYTLRWRLRFNDLVDGSQPGESTFTAKAGVLFGAETDVEPLQWADNASVNPRGYPAPGARMYRATQRQNGTITIGVWPIEGDPSVVNIADQAGPAMVAGEYNDYVLEVTPTQITFTRTDPTGTQHTAVASDDTLRGPYWFIEKEESFFSGGTTPNPSSENNRFSVTYRDVFYSPGA